MADLFRPIDRSPHPRQREALNLMRSLFRDADHTRYGRYVRPIRPCVYHI